MRFVHTADNHLDAPLSSLPEKERVKRQAQRLSAFSTIIDFTIKNADCLLISGDLFDSSSPSEDIVLFVMKEFERLGDIPVFIASGNHDWCIGNFNFPGNVHVFPETAHFFTFMNCRITGISFPSSACSLSQSIPHADTNSQFNILCLHGDIFSDSVYNPMNKDFLSSKGYDYIALGHVHEYSVCENIVYPGCHDGAGFDETGIKGFVFCDTDKYPLEFEFIPSSSLTYEVIDFDISEFSSSFEAANELKPLLSGNIYKVNLMGNIKATFALNIKAIYSILEPFAFYLKINDCTEICTDVTDAGLYNIFHEYLFDNFDEETAQSALRYGIYALKGVDSL